MRILLLIFIMVGFVTNAKANNLLEDQNAVRILGYFMVGRDDTPQANVTVEQFRSHLEILKEENHNVISMDQMIAAYDNGSNLPPRSVVITFDGGDKSILTEAAPLLEKYKFPYTVFISTARVDSSNPHYLDWKDLKTLSKSGLLTIGLHPHTYSSLTFETPQNVRKSINNATSRLRNQGIDIKYFSFPFGEYNEEHLSVLKDYNFTALFGQHSGVAHANQARHTCPRFMITENYADADRFKMILNSLPFPVTDVSLKSSIINSKDFAIGFTVPETLTDDLDRLSCFTSNQPKPEVIILGQRIELRLAEPINQDRFRVNCTLPVFKENKDKTDTWRWLGFLFQVSDAF